MSEKKRLVFKRPIEWRVIKDFMNYMINNYGQVKNVKTGRLLKHGITNDGYHFVSLCQNGKKTYKRVNRLVAEAFIDNSDPNKKMQVDHIDHLKHNNCVWNLQWLTPLENNRKKLSCTSPYQYVTWSKQCKKWHVKMWIQEKQKHFGFFAELFDAIECVNTTIHELKLSVPILLQDHQENQPFTTGSEVPLASTTDDETCEVPLPEESGIDCEI